MNILVTGGAGYIGSHACKALAQAGYTPISYDNLDTGHDWAVQWGPLERGDIADRTRLDSVIMKYRPSAVMHFAAHAYVGESVQNPGKYYRNNVAGTLTLLEALRDHEIDKFIFSSTCSIYGNPETVPICEEHSQRPINPYGSSKMMVEAMLRDFDFAHGLRSITLRYFNAAGADPDGEIGEEHEPETHLIPLVLDVANDKRLNITIFGDDYDTHDGSCIRDYIHVTDLADAHILALRMLEKGATTTAYNLGNGCGFSVKDVIKRVEFLTGKKIRVEIGQRREGDPACLIAQAALAKNELNWKPRYCDLDTIIMTAIKWSMRKN